MTDDRITYNQIKKIYAAAKSRGIDNEAIHNIVYNISKKEHISELTKSEGILVIDALEGKRIVGNNEMITGKQKMYIKGLSKELEWNETRLRGFIKKVGGVSDTNFLTKKNASNVIEGLKKLIEKGYGGDKDE